MAKAKMNITSPDFSKKNISGKFLEPVDLLFCSGLSVRTPYFREQSEFRIFKTFRIN